MTTDTTDIQADTLRDQLVDELRADGHVRTHGVEHAMRAVPRHRFLPGLPAPDCYRNQQLVTKRDHAGAALSSISKPSVVAVMLEQLHAAPGHRILEIGAGAGYNAALLRHLVGATGQVTTIDIDAEVADEARTRLDAAGYTDVHVITGDGALGDQTRAPFDRIIVTAGAWDLPPAWWHQLTDGGRIVVPLRWRGLTRSVAFDQQGDSLVSQSLHMCGFIPMRGDHDEHALYLDDDVALHHDEDQPLNPDTLRGVLNQPRHESWSGVTVGPTDPFDGVWLRLATTEPATCRITAQPPAVDSGRVTPAIPLLNPALAEPGSLAYFTFKRLPGSELSELGAIGHGPNGADLADRINEHTRAWDHNRTATPTLEAFPAGTPDDQLPQGHIIDKRHTRLTFSW